MIKCEVMADCVLAIRKGSIVDVDERQYEVARNILKPVGKTGEESPIETAELPKAKKTRKK